MRLNRNEMRTLDHLRLHPEAVWRQQCRKAHYYDESLPSGEVAQRRFFCDRSPGHDGPCLGLPSQRYMSSEDG